MQLEMGWGLEGERIVTVWPVKKGASWGSLSQEAWGVDY